MKMDLTAMIDALETREQEAALRALQIYNKEVEERHDADV